MSTMSARERAQILGLEPVEEEKPTTQTALAKAAHHDLDSRVEKWVETQRRPGETFEGAYNRKSMEEPQLFAELMKARDQATHAHGIGNEAVAQPLGAPRAW
jgi:hypothetical protein